MMDKAPRVTAQELIRALERDGFRKVRQSGSHQIFRNASGMRVTVPYHTGKTLHLKLFKSILRDAGWSVKQFDQLRS